MYSCATVSVTKIVVICGLWITLAAMTAVRSQVRNRLQPTEITLRIPDLFSLTPFTWAGCNPHYHPSDRKSTEWILSYGQFSSDYKRARFMATATDLLGAYAYPYADAKGLRIASDWVTMLATLDQFTDDQDGDGAKSTRDTFVRALTGKSIDNIHPVTQFTTDFMRSLSDVPEEVVNRFVTHLIEYIDDITKEADLRTTGEFPIFEEYINIRRNNSGLIPCCDVLEITLGITLPTEVIEDKDFQTIVLAAVDMMSLSNDIYSYPLEYTSGLDACNAVTVLMQNKGLSVQEAIDHTAELYRGRADTIVACKSAMRSFGAEVDELVCTYVKGLEQVICGNNSWSLDTPRYFGDQREEVKRTGVYKINQTQSNVVSV